MIFNYSAKPVFYVFFDDHINFNFQLFFARQSKFLCSFSSSLLLSLSIRHVWWIANNEWWKGNELRWRNFKKLNRNKKNDSSLSKNIFCHLSCRLSSVSVLARHDEKWSNIYQKKLKLTYWWRRLKSKHIFHTQKKRPNWEWERMNGK